MRESYVITKTCSIRDHTVVIDHRDEYKGSEEKPEQFLTGIYQRFTISYPKFHKMDILSKLGFLSVELLLRDTRLPDRYQGHEVGVILMNASSSLVSDRHHQESVMDRANYFPSPAVFVYTLPNILIGEISIRHRITGEGTFFILERFDASFLVNYVNALFNAGVIQCCITGWIETNGEDYESSVYFVEKTDSPFNGIANFDAATIQKIYDKVK
jgi:hypothetical protein